MPSHRQIRPSKAAYIDTCVISGRVKGELCAADSKALDAILSAYLAERIDLARSTTVDQEIEAIPAQYRQPHTALLATFMSIPSPVIGGLTRPTAMGFPLANPSYALWRRLAEVLPDENDRWHAFATAKSRLSFLITVDRRTILSRSARLRAVSGIRALSPAEFVSEPGSPFNDA